MNWTIQPYSEKKLKRIQEGLFRYNRQYFHDVKDISCAIEMDGEYVAGLLGFRADELVMVDIIWVEESHRGQGMGAQLLAYAEEQGRALGAKWLELNTFGFQAPKFYEKAGYTMIGKVEPCVGEYGHYYFKKDL